MKRIFNTGRYSTVTDNITIPYKNGILHGMDLGYDNKTVAAKSWAALFAAREWAMKAEQGLLEEQPEKPQKSWKELFRDIDELNRSKSTRKNGFHGIVFLKKIRSFLKAMNLQQALLSALLLNFCYFGKSVITGKWGIICRDTSMVTSGRLFLQN